MPDRPTAARYREAGVDLDAANRAKRRIAELAAATFDADVVPARGGFGGGYALRDAPADPVLVSSTDGVGTKVLVAQRAGRHDTVGEDLVNHCVDDLLAAGAHPLFFLDYIACGRLDENVVVALVEGFARGCRVNRIALVGGETAEMPDLYPPGGYDLAGFVVGVASRDRLGAPSPVAAGDAILGLASTGLHTNGYSLARRIVFDEAGQALDDPVPWGDGTWADALLAVHRSYRDAVEPLLDDPDVHAMAHLTGGGFPGNLPRALPPGLGARVDGGAWERPPLFDWLAEAGRIDDEEMARVFNLGIGFCLVVDAGAVARVAAACAAAGFPATEIGVVVPGDGVAWT